MCIGMANGGKQGVTVEHRGYILQQGSTSPHYMIFKADNHERVLHASCTKYLSKDEAKKHIDNYLKLKDIDWSEQQ